MDQNIEGMIKLVRFKSAVAAAVHSSNRRSSLIPIVWTIRSRFSDHGPTKLKQQKNAKSCKQSKASCTGEQTYNGVRSSPSVVSAWRISRATSTLPCRTTIEGDEEGVDVCVVCMERTPDLQLLPCRHDRFCRQCMVESICTWVRPEAPSCPLCRGAFHTMVLLD